MTYQDSDIRDVLAAFAAFSGRTIVVGKDVQGTVTAEVRDQPWDVALQSILASQQLAASEDQYGIITVDSYKNIQAKQASEPLVTQLVTLNYANAFGLVKTVQSLLARDCGPGQGGGAGGAAPAQSQACQPRGNVVADTGTNTLLITEAQSHMQDVVNYIRDLDIRTPQVSIKAKIIFVDRTVLNSLGLAYDIGDNGTFFNSLVQRINPQTGQPYVQQRHGGQCRRQRARRGLQRGTAIPVGSRAQPALYRGRRQVLADLVHRRDGVPPALRRAGRAERRHARQSRGADPGR